MWYWFIINSYFNESAIILCPRFHHTLSSWIMCVLHGSCSSCSQCRSSKARILPDTGNEVQLRWIHCLSGQAHEDVSSLPLPDAWLPYHRYCFQLKRVFAAQGNWFWSATSIPHHVYCCTPNSAPWAASIRLFSSVWCLMLAVYWVWYWEQSSFSKVSQQ